MLVAALATSGVIAINLFLILAAPPSGQTTATTTTRLERHRLSDRLRPFLEATPARLLRPEGPDATAPEEPEDFGVDERDERDERSAAEPKRRETVHEASARTCSTSSVDGLSRQIIAQARCIDADAFVRVPARPNLVTGSHVFLYLDASARDRLVQVLDAHRDRTMTVHSALRTVAQQYLLWRWASSKRCNIQLATPPGESNHETGLALDIGEPSAWRSALEEQQFRWLGAVDRVHFDYKGGRASARDGIDVTAFQQLWNLNHPDDTIAESGRYGSATEQRLRKSPAAGFAIGPRCRAPRGGGSPARSLAR